ncbi:NF038132 family protein [Primorskyibacter sp. S187A]|uniref:NF038132 family protein n=1 Tax=Primorskyibacter sp. S187A TaxID=3415130 RepID=UPI003C7B7531
MKTLLKTTFLTAALAALAGTSLHAATTQGVVPSGWVGQGGFGSGTADGDIVAAPVDDGSYRYVTTTGGLDGVGALDGVGGDGDPENGSTLTTSMFDADAGDELEFFFNYMTSDGGGFADYAWARLLDDGGDQVALLFTARTTPGGNTVPGFSMPDPEATLTPGLVSIVDGATEWSALGGDSGSCFSTGCGNTGWVQSVFEIADGGSYSLQFGVTNWNDSQFASGMAVAGANIGGVAIDPPTAPVPLPAAGWLMIAGLGGLAAARRATRKKA